MALRFLNHSNYADFVGFILPQLFDSNGKGSTKSRVEGLNLIHCEKIKPNFEFSKLNEGIKKIYYDKY